LLPTNTSCEVTTRLIDVLEDEVDEKYYLSEEKTKKLTLDNDLGGKLNMYDYNERDKVHSINKVSPTLNTMQGGDRQPKVAIPVLTPDRLNKRQNGRRFKENGEPMFTLTSQDKHGVAIREATKKGYAIAEQGDSVNVSYPTSKTRRGRVGKQVAQTLQAGEVNQGVVMEDIRIRKLTPLECWRLQGFTDEQFYKAKDSGVSNSQLYKQSGNSVTVNVVDAIVKELL
jgi:DNA (cytosine-5)-methyltransferase 1